MPLARSAGIRHRLDATFLQKSLRLILPSPRLYRERDHVVSVYSALILAGGESRRFGGPKALLEIAGRPRLAHVDHALASPAGETIVSVASPEGEAPIRPVLPGVVLAHDVHQGRAPIGGFH